MLKVLEFFATQKYLMTDTKLVKSLKGQCKTSWSLKSLIDIFILYFCVVLQLVLAVPSLHKGNCRLSSEGRGSR